MKGLFCFKISEAVLRARLSTVRDRVDAGMVLLEVLKLMLIAPCEQKSAISAVDRVALHIGNKSRLYVAYDSSIVSVAFPFMVTTGKSGNDLSFWGGSNHEVTSLVANKLSEMLAGFRDGGLWDFLESTEYSSATAEDAVPQVSEGYLWALFRDIIVTDDGYIRYDWDAERANGCIHPEHHIDAFYSNKAAIKLGLYDRISLQGLSEIVDPINGCHYLKQFEG